MVKVVPIVPSGGNTKPLTKPKKKQVSPARHWVFTWCNYPENCVELMDSVPSSIVPKMCFKSEICPDKGTPHLQGFLSFPEHVKKRPMGIFDFTDKIHWESMSRKATIKHNLNYVSKEYTGDGKIEFWRGYKPPYRGPKKCDFWQPWMDEYAELIKTKACPRTIHWIWDEEGNKGKTAFAQWLWHNVDDVVIVSGKTADMLNGVATFDIKHGYTPSVVVVDVPRSGGINAEGLEAVKNMFFYSPKYEGHQVSGQRPHLFIFSNSVDHWCFSKDKYKVNCLT